MFVCRSAIRILGYLNKFTTVRICGPKYVNVIHLLWELIFWLSLTCFSLASNPNEKQQRSPQNNNVYANTLTLQPYLRHMQFKLCGPNWPETATTLFWAYMIYSVQQYTIGICQSYFTTCTWIRIHTKYIEPLRDALRTFYNNSLFRNITVNIYTLIREQLPGENNPLFTLTLWRTITSRYYLNWPLPSLR